MDLHNASAFTRRAFMHRGLTLASAAVTVPAFLQSSARALMRPDAPLTSVPGVPDERILVVVQLAGGNDGLNTVVPFADRAYYNARPGIAIPEREVLRLSAKGSGGAGGAEGIGLHPRLTGLKELHDQGLLAVVQGVGYPNPNRSHFKSMDIWHTAETSGTGEGWLGRYFDNTCAGQPDCPSHAGVAIGRAAPLAMQGAKTMPVSFETPDLFRWTGLDGAERDPAQKTLDALVQGGPASPDGPDSQAAFLTRTALDARIASDRIRAAVASRPLVSYPNNPLARQLAMVAAMIRAGLETRVYYTTLGGFDTHAGQGGANGPHANLMQQLGAALLAFQQDLKAQGNDGRVLTMSFSEFGRRVGQNASNGTDHGAAAPMFLIGPMITPGVRGDHPSLTDLDQGDLKFGVDFRSVYAGILTDWLKTDPVKVLGGRFRPAKVVRG
ncbi:MAG TPA: hypothetical protein DEB06_04745 [Phycisphaerales bacterium]|nr:hypothetical protein [Phycisphaerales bacterium]